MYVHGVLIGQEQVSSIVLAVFRMMLVIQRSLMGWLRDSAEGPHLDEGRLLGGTSAADSLNCPAVGPSVKGGPDPCAGLEGLRRLVRPPRSSRKGRFQGGNRKLLLSHEVGLQMVRPR